MTNNATPILDEKTIEIEIPISPEVHFSNGEIDQFMPALSLADAKKKYEKLVKFTQEMMISGKDYGSFGGIKKATLLKPGAEKLINYFGFRTTFDDDSIIERWDDDDPLFFYRQTCNLWRGHILIAAASGSANSKEKKYRWRWVHELPKNTALEDTVSRGGVKKEFVFAIEESKTEGDYSKPAAYWQTWKDAIKSGEATEGVKRTRKGEEYPAWIMSQYEYRVPNGDIFSETNTILKMAQKRAMVAAVLIGCMASEFYTQDIEDLEYYDDPYIPDKTAPPKTETTPIRKQAKESKEIRKANSKLLPRPAVEPAPKPSEADRLAAVLDKYEAGHALSKRDYFDLAYAVFKVKDASLVKQIVDNYHESDNFAPAILILKTHIPPEKE